jgi:hypothetical protein
MPARFAAPASTALPALARAAEGNYIGEKQPSLKVELGLMALDGSVEMFS